MLKSPINRLARLRVSSNLRHNGMASLILKEWLSQYMDKSLMISNHPMSNTSKYNFTTKLL